MPRPLLNPQQQAQSRSDILSASAQTSRQSTQQISKVKLDRMLRKSRSKEYMEAMTKLDAGGHTHNQDKVNEIIDAIRNEFPEVEISGVLLGCVAICYLGRPYEVHILDFAGGIVEHYVEGQALPNGLEKARSIAIRGGYSFIEVYVDCCRCVSSNGSVSVIPC